jgi:acetyl esterase/lipase
MSWSEFSELPARGGGERIAWGEGPREFGVLRLPAGAGPHPVALLLHGGCWCSEADADYLSHLGAWLADLGWATWTPSFPRSDDPGGGWPGTLAAVGRAADHLRTLASAGPLDAARAVAIGHSSGGHLALWLAARPGLSVEGDAGALRGPAPLSIRGVIGLAPIADLGAFHRDGGFGCDDDAVERLLGAGPGEAPERWEAADPACRVPLRVPQLVLTGALDDVVPPGHSAAYAARAQASGDDVSCLDIAGAGHFELVAPASASWSAVARPMSRFLEGLDGFEARG